MHTQRTRNPRKGEELVIILKNYDLLVKFMQHLIKEFSMECLLALIEFHQFRSHVMERFHLCEETETTTSRVNIAFSENVPKSDIVYTQELQDNEKDDDAYVLCKLKACKLYHKYIKNGAEFEINISHRSRVGLTQLMANQEIWISEENGMKESDLATVFDGAMLEMITMLNFSLTRFKYGGTV
eukprot:729701_1